MIVIKGGTLVDGQRTVQADVRIDQGKIQAIGLNLEADQVIDATGQVVMPAFVDLHAHFRDPGLTYKEDLETGSQAALKGGYGTVVLMANTKPTVDHNEVYQDIVDRAEALDLIQIYQNYAVSKGLKGEEWVDLDHLPASVKFLSDDGFGLQNNKVTFQLFERINQLGKGLMIHEEDRELSEIDYRYAEDVHTMRDVYFSGKTGARVHFCHVSTIDACKAVEYGKAQGYPVTMEVTPHHLYLSGLDYKVHPPIREEADRRYLVEALIRGAVDCVATDHAPHSEEDKLKGSPGMIGLETAFQVVYKVLVEEYGQDLQLVSRVMSQRPAEILEVNKGRIEVGYDADLVLVDLAQSETIQPNTIRSKSKNTPMMGETFKGVVTTTVVNGEIKYRRDINEY